MKRLWELITIDDDGRPLLGHPWVFPVFLLALLWQVVRGLEMVRGNVFGRRIIPRAVQQDHQKCW